MSQLTIDVWPVINMDPIFSVQSVIKTDPIFSVQSVIRTDPIFSIQSVIKTDPIFSVQSVIKTDPPYSQFSQSSKRIPCSQLNLQSRLRILRSSLLNCSLLIKRSSEKIKKVTLCDKISAVAEDRLAQREAEIKRNALFHPKEMELKELEVKKR